VLWFVGELDILKTRKAFLRQLDLNFPLLLLGELETAQVYLDSSTLSSLSSFLPFVGVLHKKRERVNFVIPLVHLFTKACCCYDLYDQLICKMIRVMFRKLA
jgi:hypothetical protein